MTWTGLELVVVIVVKVRMRVRRRRRSGFFEEGIVASFGKLSGGCGGAAVCGGFCGGGGGGKCKLRRYSIDW